MSKQKPPTEHVIVQNNLTTVPDSKRAADLFSRILRAVREQSEEDQRKQDSGKSAA